MLKLMVLFVLGVVVVVDDDVDDNGDHNDNVPSLCEERGPIRNIQYHSDDDDDADVVDGDHNPHLSHVLL